MDAETRIFGIRHHGPGSARSLRRALEAMAPDCLLVEGPPDAADVVALAADPGMKPPIALLVYEPDKPAHCVFYPFAVFSPEWQAIQYALAVGIPVRFMDLPQEHRLALDRDAEDSGGHPEEAEPPAESNVSDTSDACYEAIEPPPMAPNAPEVRADPLNWIAEAAGYADGETWWEHMVEQRNDDRDLFQAILEIMTAVREAIAVPAEPIEEMREAWMRQTMRAANRDGFRRIAVVCGAWHGPALAESVTAAADARLLKGLPRVKTAATWVPWTYGRLTQASGYGAGIASPSWYERLWLTPDRPQMHWIATAAALLREEDIPAAPASVIEAVRLAETLSAVRNRRRPGLAELCEAVQSVFCFGSDLPMRLISERLVVGERLGEIAESTPLLPIQNDLRREQRRLRLPPEAVYAIKDLDLRNRTDLDRSLLLHRLRLLGTPWGELQRTGGGKGTFHEIWRLQWLPELDVKLIEANVFGNTVVSAAENCAAEAASKCATLAGLTSRIESALLADLSGAVPLLMRRLEEMAAATSDVPHLMDALPALANTLRYGSVRQTDAEMMAGAVDGLLTRICIGLPPACSSLNDDAAAAMFDRLRAVDSSVRLMQDAERTERWSDALVRLAEVAGLNGLVYGRCCRLLLDLSVWTPEEVERRMRLALSPAEDPARSAAWIDGLLRESGDLLVHTDSLWPILDRWVAGLPSDAFPVLLPLVRRTFGSFPAALRRQIGERAAAGAGHQARPNGRADAEIDHERAAKTLPLLAQILGLPAQ